MRIRVKHKHIRNGERDDCSRCPVALALLEQVCYADVGVHVYTSDAYIRRAGLFALWAKLPRSAVRFIRRFDQGKKTKPFNFELKEVNL